MREITFTDDELTVAARQVVQALADSLPEPSEYERPFEYSDDFLAKMDRMIKYQRRREMAKRVAQRAASVALAFLIGASTWLAADAEARATFLTWVREVYEDSFIYRYFIARSEEELCNYEITSLPEGYMQTVFENDGESCFQLYQCGDSTITLFYYRMQEGWEHIVKDKNSDSGIVAKNVHVAGVPADLYEYKDGASASELIWVIEKDGIVFHISGFLQENELIEIAESVSLKKYN